MEGVQEKLASADNLESQVRDFGLSPSQKRAIFLNRLSKRLSLYGGHSNIALRQSKYDALHGVRVSDFYRVMSNGKPNIGPPLIRVSHSRMDSDSYTAFTPAATRILEEELAWYNKSLWDRGLGERYTPKVDFKRLHSNKEGLIIQDAPGRHLYKH